MLSSLLSLLWPEYATIYTLQQATYELLEDGRQNPQWITIGSGDCILAPASRSMIATEAGVGEQVDHVMYVSQGSFSIGERVIVFGKTYEVTKVTDYNGDHVEVQCHAIV